MIASASGAVHVETARLLLAVALVTIPGLCSWALRLGLGRELVVASIRTCAQLGLVGYVLHWVFAIESLWIVLGLAALMTAAATHAAVGRSQRRIRGVYFGVFTTLALTAILTTFTVTRSVIQVEPWYRPQYVIPLLGMVFGNMLTGMSLCLDQILQAFSEGRGRVEMELGLGATRWEASREVFADAVRRGMIPILNAMSVAGVVSLPGMMTGQILQGADPLEAVKYQIVVMFMIAAATAMGTILVAAFVFRGVFNERHQLRAERIWDAGARR